MPASLPTVNPAPETADSERGPHERAPAITLVPLSTMVQIPGQLIEPSSHESEAAPLTVIWPVLVAGAQMSWFVQERSPAVHHADPGQLAESAAAGAAEQGEANQVRLLGESAVLFGGQARREHGGDPN